MNYINFIEKNNIQVYDVCYFIELIGSLPNDMTNPFKSMDFGIGISYDGVNGPVYLPGVGSECQQFHGILWKGLAEATEDIIAGKTKKFANINKLKTSKERILWALRYISNHNPYYIQWDKSIANKYWKAILEPSKCELVGLI